MLCRGDSLAAEKSLNVWRCCTAGKTDSAWEIAVPCSRGKAAVPQAGVSPVRWASCKARVVCWAGLTAPPRGPPLPREIQHLWTPTRLCRARLTWSLSPHSKHSSGSADTGKAVGLLRNGLFTVFRFTDGLGDLKGLFQLA